MIGKRALQAIVGDPRLTPDAVRVILHVAMLGDGEHAIKGDELEILLGGGEKPIKNAIRRAKHCGWLEERPGGRAGHYLTFRNAAPPAGLPLNAAAPGGISDQGKSENAAPPGVIPISNPESPLGDSPSRPDPSTEKTEPSVVPLRANDERPRLAATGTDGPHGGGPAPQASRGQGQGGGGTVRNRNGRWEHVRDDSS